MFAKTIIDSDAFLDMPLSAQALYFHLSMRADDDGFINNCKKIQRMINASDDDCKILAAKKFIIPFESGVIVIKHWKIHNYIQSDRYKPTVYQREKSMLVVKQNKAYKLADTESETVCIQNGYKLDTQVRLGKVSLGKDRLEIGKDSIDKENISNTHTPRSSFVKPTVLELQNYSADRGYTDFDAERFYDFYESKGWFVGKNKMKDWKAAVRNWQRNSKPRGKQEAIKTVDRLMAKYEAEEREDAHEQERNS